MFLMLKYTDITQNTYIQSWTVTEIIVFIYYYVLFLKRYFIYNYYVYFIYYYYVLFLKHF